jgi:hypothetical protein
MSEEMIMDGCTVREAPVTSGRLNRGLAAVASAIAIAVAAPAAAGAVSAIVSGDTVPGAAVTAVEAGVASVIGWTEAITGRETGCCALVLGGADRPAPGPLARN